MPPKTGTISVPSTIKKLKRTRKQIISAVGEREGNTRFEQKCGKLLKWLESEDRSKEEVITLMGQKDDDYIMVVKERGIVASFSIAKECVQNLVRIPQHKVRFEPIPWSPPEPIRRSL